MNELEGKGGERSESAPRSQGKQRVIHTSTLGISHRREYNVLPDLRDALVIE